MAEMALDLIAAQLQRLLLDGVADVKERLRNVEEALVSHHHRDTVRIDHRLDRMDERLARIERRLDLVEA
jgi:hypothetical protein